MKSDTLCHETNCRVVYADTDKMGSAYHAGYFRWFEIGRTEMLRFLGMSYKTIEENGIFLPVSEACCRFFSPVHYDDELVVETSLDNRIKAGVKFNYRIVRRQDRQVLAQGYTRHPCVNESGKVVRPPKFLIDMLAGGPKAHRLPGSAVPEDPARG